MPVTKSMEDSRCRRKIPEEKCTSVEKIMEEKDARIIFLWGKEKKPRRVWGLPIPKEAMTEQEKVDFYKKGEKSSKRYSEGHKATVLFKERGEW